jgi:hypothetical protein
MDFSSHSKVPVEFGTFAINHYYSLTCSLRLILCEFSVRIVGLEILDLLEVRFMGG